KPYIAIWDKIDEMEEKIDEINVWQKNGTSISYMGGNVGIGILNPQSKLHVDGVITASGGNSSQWNSAYSWGDHSTAGYLTSESDPIFTASAAYGITSTKISNWDTAYGWGDHATAGYLTSESDPIYSASAASGITSTKISNWDTAYGWGDHSTVGYLTSYTETDPIFGASAAKGIASTDITKWNTAYGWGDHSTVGYLTSYTETDPEVGTNVLNYVAKWDGSALSQGTIYDNGNIGIGTTTPGAKLTVVVSSGGAAAIGHSANVATGNYAVAIGYNTNASASVSTAMGHSTKASGYTSMATGYGSEASGYISTAMGPSAVASGTYSTAIGPWTTASASYSTAMGSFTKANGAYSTAIGSVNTAYGYVSTAMGGYTNASGAYSTTMGLGSKASEYGSTAVGGYTTASGAYSTAMGRSTTASGYASTSMGRNTIASGNYATAFGYATLAGGHFSTAMGRSMNVSGDHSVGIGLDYNSAEWKLTNDNTMAIMGGKVGIGTLNPSTLLHVNGVITALGGNSTNWNTAYSWGNHATAGYLTSYTETDPIFSAHAAYGMTSIMIGNWNTAYSWGDHRAMGYLTNATGGSKVGINRLNYVAKWNGTALVKGTIYDDGNIGIGTEAPTAPLHVQIDVENGTEELDQEQTSANYGLHGDDVWQSFKANKSGLLTKIQWRKNVWSYTGVYKMSILTGEGKTGLLLASQSFSTSGTGWKTVTFSNPAMVYKGQTYTFKVLKINGSRWDCQGSSLNPYPDGHYWSNVYGTQTGWDLRFKTYVTVDSNPSSDFTVESDGLHLHKEGKSGTEELDQEQTSANYGLHGDDVWQSFKANKSGLLTKIQWRKNVWSYTGIYTMSILTGEGKTGVLLASQTFTTSGAGWKTVTFSEPATVFAGETYTFRVVKINGSIWDCQGSSLNPYPNGHYWSNVYGTQTGWDLRFKTYVEVGGTPDMNMGILGAEDGSTRVITGYIDQNGTIVSGEGFICEKVSTGEYKITYKNPFTTNPTIVASAGTNNDNDLGVNETDQYHCVIHNYDNDVKQNGDFYIIIIGK
ncbi:MAG: DUF4082 domain-containing protein, partial [Thermoplasmata archaeon]